MSSTRTGAAPLGARLGLPTNGRLARRAARGDEGAFEEIFRRYHQELYRYCLAIVRNPEDAQDAVQATMAAALRALPGEEREIALRPWLYRVAHNESISLLRGRAPAANPEGAEEAISLPPETELADRDRLRQLVADMLVLPDRQRSAIVLRELNDLSYAEIGLALSSSEAGAKQTVYEARQSLHEFEQGRTMDCESVREAISAGDRRRLRGRRITSHLRSCDGCLAFEASIAQRRGDLQMLCPPLPALAAAGLLGGLLGGSSGSAAAGGGVATVGGVAGGTAAAGAGGAAGAGVAGSLAVKGASLAAAAVVAAGAADIGGVIDLPGPLNGGSESQTGGPDGGSNGGGFPVDDGDRDSAAGPSSGASAEGSSALSRGGRAGTGDNTATQRDGEDGEGADIPPTGRGDSAPVPGQTGAPGQSGSSSVPPESAPGPPGSGNESPADAPGHSSPGNGNSADAPAPTGSGNGNSANAPGHTSPGNGNSANAPGHTGSGNGNSASKPDDKGTKEPKETKGPNEVKEPNDGKEPTDGSAPAAPEPKPEPAKPPVGGGSSGAPGGGKPPIQEPPAGGPAESQNGPKPK